jgi:hypothetical protein
MVGPVRDLSVGRFFGDAITPIMILLTWLLTAPFQGCGAYPRPEIKIHAKDNIIIFFH